MYRRNGLREWCMLTNYYLETKPKDFWDLYLGEK